MDRHPQQIKRTRQDAVRREINSQKLSKLRSLIKNTLKSTDKEAVEKNYKAAISYIDKMADDNLIHRNKAARHKSQLSKHLNTVSAS